MGNADNGKQILIREQAVALDAAVDNHVYLYDISGHGKRRRDDDDSDDEIDEEYFRKLPLGYGFFPDDNVLIEEYLKPKLFNQPLPRNQIIDMDIYLHNPETLAEMYKHNSGDQEEEEEEEEEEENNVWYFFSPRYRKYPKGSRPRRSAGDGYWKATGRETQIKDVRNTVIGIRRTLVFYKGKPPMGVKTNWILREYTLNNPPPLRPNSDPMILDDCVICRIRLNKSKSKSKAKYGKKVVGAKSTISLSNGAPKQRRLSDPPPPFDGRDYQVGESSTRQSQVSYQRRPQLDQASTFVPPCSSNGVRAPQIEQLPSSSANESNVVLLPSINWDNLEDFYIL